MTTPFIPPYSKIVVGPSLEMYFVSKDTGLPLAAGIVYFYSDLNRTTLKDVYTISGTAPNYTAAILPNPATLSSVGTFQDEGGNNILPYFYPFDADGNPEQYYVEVYDRNMVLQFTREGWPPVSASASGGAANNVKNFAPNGQFLLHNSNAPNMGKAGLITQASTEIAPGGWTFERTSGSTAVDNVTFFAYGSAVSNPPTNPQYAFQLTTTTPDTDDLTKDLALTFGDVNKFVSSDLPPEAWTIAFSGRSLTGSNVSVELHLIQNYGSGGDAQNDVLLTTFSFTGTAQIFSYTLTDGFPDNLGKTIGDGSYVQIALRFPRDVASSNRVTDFMLIAGTEAPTVFPATPDSEMAYESLASDESIPNYQGYDLYCPVILGPNGYEYDHSQIGGVESLFVENGSQQGNLLYCDGSSYLGAAYSSIGIPYRRLQQVLFNAPTNGNIFGNGTTFVNANILSSNPSIMILSTNQFGVQSNVADFGTGFTMNSWVNPGIAETAMSAYANKFAVVIAINQRVGGISLSALTGTSGMTVTDNVQPSAGDARYSFRLVALGADALAAGSGNPGLYFDFSTVSFNFRMWFFVNGEVAPGSGGRTLLQCNLVPSSSSADVALMIANGISGYQTNSVRIAVPPPASSYFTFNANSLTYYVWYKINNVGTAPTMHPDAQLIEVDLTGSENAAQVLFKTQTAINSQYFAVPDLRGFFLRGNDPNAYTDPDANYRYGYFANNPSYLGTFQYDEFTQHSHEVGNEAFNSSGGPGGAGGGQETNYRGGSDTRPSNVAVNFFIRY